MSDNNNKKGFLLMLSALMVILLLAGCAHKQEAPQAKGVDTRELVRREVKDPARAEKIVVLMDKMDAEMKLQREINEQGQQASIALFRDYKTTPEQFQKHMEQINTSRMQNRQRIMDTYFQIKALTTQQEWEAISKPEGQELMDFMNKGQVPEKN